MGRTMPSFRLALVEEEQEWKSFRNALDKNDRKEFDSMFADIRLYISACSYATKPVRVQPVLMTLAFHHYKQLTKMAERMEMAS
ncbi:MAG: hypothetical protein AB1351_00370 [Thermoproteota archaeon]